VSVSGGHVRNVTVCRVKPDGNDRVRVEGLLEYVGS
jgi:hypothetical protein